MFLTLNPHSASFARSSIRSLENRMIEIHAVLPKKRKLTLNRLESQIRRLLGRKQNFSFSMMCDLPIAVMPPRTWLIALKAIGIAREKNFQTSVTKSEQKKVTFLCRQWIHCRTFATKCAWSWRRQVCR